MYRTCFYVVPTPDLELLVRIVVEDEAEGWIFVHELGYSSREFGLLLEEFKPKSLGAGHVLERELLLDVGLQPSDAGLQELLNQHYGASNI